jgi:ribosomal protein S26
MWHVAKQRPRNKQLYNSRCSVMALQTTTVARQWLSSNQVVTPIDTNATNALQQGTVFSMQSVPRCYKQGQLPIETVES